MLRTHITTVFELRSTQFTEPIPVITYWSWRTVASHFGNYFLVALAMSITSLSRKNCLEKRPGSQGEPDGFYVWSLTQLCRLCWLMHNQGSLKKMGLVTNTQPTKACISCCWLSLVTKNPLKGPRQGSRWVEHKRPISSPAMRGSLVCLPGKSMIFFIYQKLTLYN